MKSQTENSYAESNEAIIRRLKKIEGQVKGLQKMIESGKCCNDVLIQVAAVKAAVNRVGILLIDRHSRTCLKSALENQGQDDAINDLLEILTKFMK